MASLKQERLSLLIDGMIDDELGWGLSSITHAVKRGVSSSLHAVSKVTSPIIKVGNKALTPLYVADNAARGAAKLASRGLKYTPAYTAARMAYHAAKKNRRRHRHDQGIQGYDPPRLEGWAPPPRLQGHGQPSDEGRRVDRQAPTHGHGCSRGRWCPVLRGLSPHADPQRGHQHDPNLPWVNVRTMSRGSGRRVV